MDRAEGIRAAIAALQAAGVDVTPEDDSAVVLDLRLQPIVRLVTTPPEVFDRARYERLMQLWTTLHPATEDADDAD